MTFDEIVSRPRRFRLNEDLGKSLLGATFPTGGSFDLHTECASDRTIRLYAPDKSTAWWFPRSDVSELTPLSFGGRGIAIGDEVRDDEMTGWRKVYGFHWYDGGWRVQTVMDNDFAGGCYPVGQSSLAAHRTPNDAPTRTVEQVLASLPDADKAIVMRALKTTNNGVITGRSTRLCEHGWYEDGTCVNCKK